MFLLVCGEDTVAARNYIHKLKTEYRSNNARIFEPSAAELEDFIRSESNTTLFGEPVVYLTQGLLPYWGKQKKKISEQIQALQTHPAVTVIDWEPERSLYDLKLKAAPYAKEFKPAASLFDIQDLCAPGCREQFIASLRILVEIHDPFLIFSLLQKRIRILLLIKTGQSTGNIAPFMKAKAARQARMWSIEKLAAFYTGLARIDHGVKSSSAPLSLAKSLEVLAAYYL